MTTSPDSIISAISANWKNQRKRHRCNVIFFFTAISYGLIPFQSSISSFHEGSCKTSISSSATSINQACHVWTSSKSTNEAFLSEIYVRKGFRDICTCYQGEVPCYIHIQATRKAHFGNMAGSIRYNKCQDQERKVYLLNI